MNNVNPARPAKGKGHFNIIDILIIIFILLVAGGAVFLFIFTGTGAADKTAYDIEYQLWYDQQRPEFSDRIKAGDKVYDLSGEYALGEVVAVDVRPCIVDSYDKMSEQMIGTIMPDRYSIYVTVKGKATKKNEAYYIGPVRLVVGSRIDTRYPDFQSTASCVQVGVPVSEE